ncbi:hypothetical protein [Enterobacter bugandensis]
MKMNHVDFTRMFTTAAITMAILGSGVASAASVSDSTSQTATVSFVQPTPVLSLAITPVAHLVAGEMKNGDKIADFSISTATASNKAFRITNTPNGNNTYTISGSNNADNKLVVAFPPSSGTGAIQFVGCDNRSTMTIEGNSWETCSDAVTSTRGDVVVSGNQTIVADSYTLNMEAANYIP